MGNIESNIFKIKNNTLCINFLNVLGNWNYIRPVEDPADSKVSKCGVFWRFDIQKVWRKTKQGIYRYIYLRARTSYKHKNIDIFIGKVLDFKTFLEKVKSKIAKQEIPNMYLPKESEIAITSTFWTRFTSLGELYC